ncbi:MAG: hypothetical protein JNK78_03180 [Planctomycetes bacterium]|nr:hypothetical protein [Planctomycetota bacterium]
MHSPLLAEVRRHAESAGINLVGLVDAERFDGSQEKEFRASRLAPKCGTIVVLGTAGRAFWQHYSAAHDPANADPCRYAREAVRAIERRLAVAGVGCSCVPAACPGPIRFARLGEAAGFGSVSPVSGLLLHPQFGPWLRVRAALLVDGRPFGEIPDASISDRFHPCCGCSKPCLDACPAAVHDGTDPRDLARCATHRHAGNCEFECRVRSACPLGAEHRDVAAENAHRHGHALPTLRRGFGLGVWRFVPAFLRRRL